MIRGSGCRMSIKASDLYLILYAGNRRLMPDWWWYIPALVAGVFVCFEGRYSREDAQFNAEEENFIS